MKKLLFFIVIVFSAHAVFAQSYIPMPADSASWRYREYDIDYVTQVIDMILFVNGTDTIAPAALGGRTYHKIFSRGRIITVPNDSIPPIVTVDATYPDTYFGAMRDSGRQVFQLTLSGEIMMYDFTAAIGDSIPAYSGKDKVIAIDSVLLGGIYHRRFLTNDSTFYVIEGVGSNRGLITDLNDGSGTVQFFCFTDTQVVVYTPDSAIECTYVYPIGYTSGTGIVNKESVDIEVSPVPAHDVLHLTTSASGAVKIVVYNSIGQAVWNGDLQHKLDIPVASWATGVYYLQCKYSGSEIINKKIIIQ